MAKSVLVSLDLNQNELQNFLVHVLAVAPLTPSEAQMYYNSANNKLFIHDGTSFIDITGQVRTIGTGTPALTVDNTDPANPILAIANASGVNSGLLTSAFFNDLTNATATNTASTLVERDASGNFAAGVISATTVTGLSSPVLASDATNKAYVDNLIASGVTIIAAIDASTNPDYPAAVVGDAYHISVAGLIGGASGVQVEVGDLIVNIVDAATGDHATVGSSWIIMQRNIDLATEIVAGIARKATQAEVNLGTEADAYVTPLTLETKLASFGTGDVSKFIAVIGNGVNTQFTVNHALAQQFVQVQVYDAVTNEEVIVEVVLTDANNSDITFAVAPASNAYRVIVEG
jgi:hypothetical protein